MIRTRLVKIGNSRGIRIPKPVVEQIGLEEEVELEVQDQQLVIRPAKSPRHGWEEAFRRMAEQGDDELLDEEANFLTEWEAREWEW